MERKHRIAFLLIGLAVLVALAGCAQPEKPSAPETPKVEPIKIGFALPITSDVGRDMMYIHQMMAEKINSKGGVSVGGVKRPLKLYFEDTEELKPGSPLDKALLAVEKLITEKGCKIIVGGVLSEPTIAEQEYIASKHPGVIYIYAGSVTEKPGERIKKEYDKYKYSFRGWPVNVSIFLKLFTLPLEVAREKYPKMSRVYILGEDLLWAHATAKAVSNWLENNGFEVVGTKFTPKGATDFTAELSDIKDKNPHAVILLYHATSLPILKQAYDMGLSNSILFISPDPMGARLEYWKESEGKANYFVDASTSPTLMKKMPSYTALFNEFRERYGHSPATRISDFDLVPLLAYAIEKAGSTDPDKIVEAMETMSFKGPSGMVYKYTKAHDQVYGLDYAWTPIIQWYNGEYKVIWPEKVADGKLILPPGLEERLK